MPFEAVTSQRLYEKVAGQIAELIQRGEFKPGDRLPPERDLSAKLGVSRPTVREAMIALEIAGLVEVRMGAGTTVVARQSTETFLSGLADAGTGPIELVQARKLVEPAVVAEATRRATDADLDAIMADLARMRAATETPEHREADRLFHKHIAEATGNTVVVAIVDGLWREMFSPLFERMGRLTGLIPQTHDITLAEHERIAEAIAARDPAAAEAAMTAHLDHVERILSGTPASGEDLAQGDAA